MNFHKQILFLIASLLFACKQVSVNDLDPTNYSGGVNDGTGAATFSADVSPLFSQLACTSCHSGTFPQGSLDLSASDASTLYGIVVNEVDKAVPSSSKLLQFPTQQGSGSSHPISQLKKDDANYKLILSWIQAGAQND